MSVLRSDGTAIPRAAHTAGVALEAARRWKGGRHPELVGPRARSRLVVFGVEVGGRWSVPKFHQPTRQGTCSTNLPPSSRTGLAHPMGFHGVLCGGTGSRFFTVGASSGSGADGDTPLLHDVERDLYAAGLKKKKNLSCDSQE